MTAGESKFEGVIVEDGQCEPCIFQAGAHHNERLDRLTGERHSRSRLVRILAAQEQYCAHHRSGIHHVLSGGGQADIHAADQLVPDRITDDVGFLIRCDQLEKRNQVVRVVAKGVSHDEYSYFSDQRHDIR
jgi:hypothetical protein